MELDFTPQLLIVDDRQENLELLKALLDRLEVEMELVQSPIKALQDIEKKEYALIILDVQMPQMDGFLLAQKIRSGMVNKSTPIIFLTAIYLDKKSESRGYECGGVDFIMKPFDTTILLNKVNIFLDLYTNRRLLESQNEKLTIALKEKSFLESRLRNLASDYRSILEGQSELILKMDGQKRVEFANRAFTDFFDYTIDGIIKDPLSKISIALQEQISKGIESLNGRDRVIVIEESFLNSKGNNVFLEWTIYKEVEFDDTCFLAIGRDISDQKKITESLVQKENVLREIQKKTKIGSFEWDSYSKFIRGSDEFLRLYELSADEEQNVFDQIMLGICIEDRNAIQRMFLNFPRKNQKIEFEHRYNYKDGTIKYFKVEINSEYDEAEDILKLFGLVCDLSQEKALEITFKESLSLDNEAYVDKAIFELNEDNCFSYVNDYACRFLECMDLKKSKNIEFIQFFEDNSKIKNLLDLSHSKKGFVFEVLSVVTKKNKKKRIVLAAHQIVVDNKKGVRGMMLEIAGNGKVGEDTVKYQNIITGLKKQEKEFEQSTLKLKNKVDEELKTNDFHRQLLSKKSELESLGKMASSIVNEINQPLAGISMVMDNLLLRLSMNKLDENYIREKCAQVFVDIDRIKKYLSQIGIYNSSQKESTEELIDVNKIIRLSIGIVQKQYVNSNIDWAFKESKDDLYVIGNKYKFQKVLCDLLSNAYESIEPKFKDVKSEYNYINIATNLNDEKVMITIKDNGCGIAPDNLNYIFEPFFTTKQSGIGSGLGLYISKGIVQKMNGQILVKSKKDEYTEMTLILPYEFESSKKEIIFEKN